MASMRLPRLGVLAIIILATLALMLSAGTTSAQGAWTIRSFSATYQIEADGTLNVIELIEVDFGLLERHGIFRDIPVKYDYEGDYHRVIEVRMLTVDDGRADIPFKTSRQGGNLNIRIGDPDRTITGRQTYRIHYKVTG